MVGSFRLTVVTWLDQTLKADLYIRPATDMDGAMGSKLDPQTLKAFGQIPGVKSMEKLRTLTMPWNGQDLSIVAIDMNTTLVPGRVSLKSGGDPSATLQSMTGQLLVLASEPLALKYHVKPGDKMVLAAAAGPATLTVKDIYYDYSNDHGTLMMDRGVYADLFKDNSVNAAALYLQPGFDPEAVTQDILRRLPEGTKVFIQSNGTLKGGAMKVFDQTFAITYGMEAIALLVAVMGILTTLTSLILERKQEIILLRYIGATRGKVTRMILWEAAWIGFLGNLMGLLAGPRLGVAPHQCHQRTVLWVDHSMARALGVFLVWALGLVFAATLAAGFYPARVADNLPTMREVTQE